MRGRLAGLLVWIATGVGATEHLVPAEPGAAKALFEAGQIQSGDTVTLAAGDHGTLVIKDQTFSPPVVVRTDPEAPARVQMIFVQRVSGLEIRGLSVRAAPDRKPKGDLVAIGEGGNILLDGIHVTSGDGFQDWSKAEWRPRVQNGVVLNSPGVTLQNSTIEGVYHGVTSFKRGARVENNQISYFAGDGIRALGDLSVYSGNRIETCLTIDQNHDDGIQSWSVDAEGRPGKGVVKDVLIDRNVIRNGTHPFGCHMQGIGLFDGMFEGWTITNNLIQANHWHGITVMGGTRVVVDGNIVIDQDRAQPGPPWVTITAHKDGRPSTQSVISRNTVQTRVGAHDRYKPSRPGVRVQRNGTIPWNTLTATALFNKRLEALE